MTASVVDVVVQKKKKTRGVGYKENDSGGGKGGGCTEGEDYDENQANCGCEALTFKSIGLYKHGEYVHFIKQGYVPFTNILQAFCQTFIIIIIYIPSVDPNRITKSKWIWKLSHFRENKEYIHYKVNINNKAQYHI